MPMAEVAKLVPRKNEFNQDALNVATSVYEHAKAGDVSCLMVIEWDNDGMYRITASSSEDTLKKIGALTMLLHDLTESL